MRLKFRRGKRYTNAMDRILRWQRELTGWRIAQAMRDLAAGPEAYCTNAACHGRQMYLALTAGAAFAEDVAAGRTPDIEPAKPCTAAALAAEAKLAAPR